MILIFVFYSLKLNKSGKIDGSKEGRKGAENGISKQTHNSSCVPLWCNFLKSRYRVVKTNTKCQY